MSRAPKKSETLTIRLDPKTRFMLEFMARLRGQTITTVVERAIAEAAGRSGIVVEGSNFGDSERTWKDFWSISEGERALRLAREPQLFPTYEEEMRSAFADEHWPFFFTSSQKDDFKRYYVDVLWPRIDEFVELHQTKRSSDYFAAGKAMQEALRAAQLKAPDWPIVPPVASRRVAKPDEDEIPF